MHDGVDSVGTEKIRQFSLEFRKDLEEFVECRKQKRNRDEHDTQTQSQDEDDDFDFPKDTGKSTETEKPTPTATWLLKVGLATIDNEKRKGQSQTLVAEAFDAVGSALASLRRDGSYEQTDSQSPNPVDDGTRKRIADATLTSLALPGGGQRSDVTRAALRMVTTHCASFIKPPGLLLNALQFFRALLLCRTSNNKNIRQTAQSAMDTFLTCTSDALADDSTANEQERQTLWTELLEETLTLMETPNVRAKERTVLVRAVGKLAKAGASFGDTGTATNLMTDFKPDLMLSRIARWTSSGEQFSEGSNDFELRYEAFERQIAVVGAYADLLVARQASDELTQELTVIPHTALEQITAVTRWSWDHYFTANDRAREDCRYRMCELFEALLERGGVTTLAGVLSKLARPLLALTLRVAPPDPIDSHLFRAPPEPLWPKYVSLWVFILGGEIDGVKGFEEKGKGKVGDKKLDLQRSDVSEKNVDETENRVAPSSAAANAAYDAFVREVLQLCQTLQLGVVPAVTSGVTNDPTNETNDQHQTEQLEDDATTSSLALELGEGVAAKNPGDMQTFLCLVDLACAVLEGAPNEFIKPWLTTLVENVAALSAAHPLLSGFYKIARVALVAGKDAGVFSIERSGSTPSGDTTAARETCRAFLLDVLSTADRLSDELRASALHLLLAAPAGLLTANELAPALRDALAVGVQHPPLADAALDVLESWTWKQEEYSTDSKQSGHLTSDIQLLLPSLVASLRPYVNRKHAVGSFDESVEGGNNSQDLDGAGAAYRAAKRARESALLADRSTGDVESDIDVRVARILGAVGGVAHVLLDHNGNELSLDERKVSSEFGSTSSSTLWDFEKRVSVDLEVGEGTCVTIWLDQVIPRAAHVALTSTDRSAKVAACEFLHAATLTMVGRNARRFVPEAGDQAREATPFHKIYKKLFPVVLKLAIDTEPVTKTLFSALATQLVRWFTRNQAREAVETMALLDAIVEGLRWKDQRDTCAALAAECLKWSVRLVSSGDLSGGGRGTQRGANSSTNQNVAVNVSSLLRRLFAFQTHPEPARRLGASVALRMCLNELRQFPEHAEAHALEILETTLRSLRLAECDPPGAGAAEAGALLARAATRACARHAASLSRPHAAASDDKSGSNKNPARGGSFGTLPRLTSWIFTDGTARVETRARLESQLAFSALLQRSPGYINPRAWVTAARAKHEGQNRGASSGQAAKSSENGDDSEPRFWPFRVSVPITPDPQWLASDADTVQILAVGGSMGVGTQGDLEMQRTSVKQNLELAEAWMKSLVASLHWARWGLERNLVTVEDLLKSSARGDANDATDATDAHKPTQHPLRACAYFLRHGVPCLLAEEANDVGDRVERSVAVSSSPAARAWRKTRVKLAVQILVLAELVARESNGVGAFFKQLDQIVEGGVSHTMNAHTNGAEISGLARLACVACLAPERLGADVVGGRMDDVNQLAGAAARVLVPMMGEQANPDVAPLRTAARQTLRQLFTEYPAFDLGAADAMSAEGLRRARRLAAGYRALANVNLLRPLLPAQSKDVNAEVVNTSGKRLARRLLLAARALGPDATPAQTEAGREWVTLAAHIGAAPEFVVQLVLGDVDMDGTDVEMDVDGKDVDDPNLSSSTSTKLTAMGEAFLQNFPKDVVAAVRWHFPACVEILVQRIVQSKPGATAALRLLFAALELPENGSVTIVETQILDAIAKHAEEIASLVDCDSVCDANDLDQTSSVKEFERFDECRRACVELVRRAVALDAACAGTGPGQGRVLFPARPKPGSSETQSAPGDALVRAVAAVACPDTETFTEDDVGPAQREALEVFPAFLAAGGAAAAIAASAAKRLARLLRDSGASRAAAGSADGAAFAAARAGILKAAATPLPFPNYEQIAPQMLAAVIAVVVDDKDGGAEAVSATISKFETSVGMTPSNGNGDISSTWPAHALATAAWHIACDVTLDVDERITAGASVLPQLIEGAPSDTVVGLFFAKRAAQLIELLDPAVAESDLKQGTTSPGAVVAGARVAYAALAAMYERCSKETVAVGPGSAFASFNAAVSRRAVGDLDGGGTIGIATAVAAKAEEKLRRRRGFDADDVMELDGSDDQGTPDPTPEVLPNASVVAARRAAFTAFAALVARTQTKSKFYEKLLEGGHRRWNHLTSADQQVPLEVELPVGQSLRRVHRFADGNANDGRVNNGPVRGVNEPSDPSLAFTLSATLSANDPTLRVGSTSGTDDSTSGRNGNGNGDTTMHTTQNKNKKNPDEGDLDSVECDPVCEAVFVLLQKASAWGMSDIQSLEQSPLSEGNDNDLNRSTPRLFQLIANLAKDKNVHAMSRMLIIKALLRLHRREVAVAEAEAAKAAEELAKNPVLPDDETDDDGFEVVAEKSLDEIEQDRLKQAREEGNYLDLTSSQVEIITTPPEPEVVPKNNKPHVPPPRSTLSKHAFTMLPGMLRGVLDITRDAQCTTLHATLREAAVAALECESAWHARDESEAQQSDAEMFAALRELATRVVTASPSRNTRTLRQNIGLAVSLNMRLVEAAAKDAIADDASAAEVDAAAAKALRPALEAAVELIKQASSKSTKDGRLASLCGVQIIGALANSGVLDLGGDAPVVRYVPVEKDETKDEKDSKNVPEKSKFKSPGCVVADGDAAFLCIGATTCLMAEGATSGRPLHAAASSLLGVALAQRLDTIRVKNMREKDDLMEVDGDVEDEEDVDEETTHSKLHKKPEPKWCFTLRKRLKVLYDKGPQDAFVTAVERIARREPSWLTGNDGSILAQLHQLFPKLHGEPRFVAVSALARVAAVDAVKGAAFAERALTSSVDGLNVLLSTRDCQVHALVMRALADALPGVAHEHARWPRGKKMDFDAWCRAATQAEASLWNASNGAVRDAHVAFCAALAVAAPSLGDHPAVRAPLLRAVADGRPDGEDAGRRATALEYWNKRLPGESTSGTETGNIPSTEIPNSNPFTIRVNAALNVLPVSCETAVGGTAIRSMNANTIAAAKSVASGWLAATCDVLLSVPRSRKNYQKSLCDDDLARCEFRDAEVDVNWQGASLPMAPLFSTQSTHGTLHARGTGSCTQTINATPSLAYSGSMLAGGVGVLATPVAFSGGATFATQFGAATLTGDRDSREFVNDPDVLGATQAELPPWLRSSLGGDTTGGRLDGLDGLTGAKPMRRHLSATQTSAMQSVSTKGEPNQPSVSSINSAAERRRKVERERALGRKRAVKLVRKYRAGELPDVRAATPAALLDPLAQLARRDAQTAKGLLTALLDAALVADDVSDSVGGKRKAPTAGVDDVQAAHGNDSNASLRRTNSLRDGVRLAIANLLPVASVDGTLAAWALEVASLDPHAEFDPDVVSGTAFDAGCLASGVVALEARALVLRAERDAANTSKTIATDPLNDKSQSSESSKLWDALAGLHRASGDDHAARLCLSRAFDTSGMSFSRTKAGLTAQLEGDASSARDIYDALLRDEREAEEVDDDLTKNNTKQRLVRLWTRERSRCSQRLGEWDDTVLDISDTLPPPWSVDSLRSQNDKEKAIPGAAFGGDTLCAATRALTHTRLNATESNDNRDDAFALDRSLEAILAHPSLAPGGDIAMELGVEIATTQLRNGLEDTVVAHIAAIRKGFRDRWLATPRAATFARCAALQPLQCALELEEVLSCVRVSRAARDDPTKGVKALQDVVNRWHNRWPSDSKDPPEVWERVGWVRDASVAAFSDLAPAAAAQGYATSTASAVSRRRACESLVRAAKGMRRSGEINSAYQRLADAKSVLSQDGSIAPANDSWLVQKAVVKLRLAQADLPGAFDADSGERVAPQVTDAKKGKFLHNALKSLLTVRTKGSLRSHPEAEAQAAACVGALASRLARLSTQIDGVGDMRDLASLEFARAATLAKECAQYASAPLNPARGAAKASLRLALHCESILCDREARSASNENDKIETFPPQSAAADGKAHSAFHPEGLEPTLVRHALLALAGGAGARARHLVPRVLATLRGDDERGEGCENIKETSAAASEFSRLAPRVPDWLFLEWTPQLLSLLDAAGSGGDAVVGTVQKIAKTYPSAVYSDYKIARSEFSETGVKRCTEADLDSKLKSPARERFTRAVTLLDFPSQRLTWWRAHIKLLVAGVIGSSKVEVSDLATSDLTASELSSTVTSLTQRVFAAADKMVADAGDPLEINLGGLNVRFAQTAKPFLLRAVAESKKKLENNRPGNVPGLIAACKHLANSITDAEKLILERWRSSSGAAATEARPKLGMTHFSRWFSEFEDGSAAFQSGNNTAFTHSIEIPGQYDALSVPPDITCHATLVGFEPDAEVFASKQRPKKIVMRGSDGREYAFIAKGSEDLRQDDRIERLFRAMDTLLCADAQARARGLHIRTFHVAALSKRSGLLQFVSNTVPLLEALGARTKQGDQVGGKHQHWVKAQAMYTSDVDGDTIKSDGEECDGTTKRTSRAHKSTSRRRIKPGLKLSAPVSGGTSATHFLEAMAVAPRVDGRNALASLKRRAGLASEPAATPADPALRQTLLRCAGSHDAFLEMRAKYGASIAASSICGYVAGVGDRHLQNILLDVQSGSAVHIDFGYAFGTATAVLPIPELVPFRVTDGLLDGLSPNDAKTQLLGDMARTMHALRNGAALLRGVMDCFLREPLLDWRREAAQARVKAGKEVKQEEDVDDVKKEDKADAMDIDSDLVRVTGGGSSGQTPTKEEARHVSQKISIAFRKLRLGNPGVLTLAQCEAKHSGRAHWKGLKEMVLGVECRGDDTQALQSTRNRRLIGNKNECASVEEQVALLLELATDPLVLATSWSGWRPWL